MRTELKGLVGQSFWYSLGGILSRVAAFLLIPLYTRYLSTADYGIIGVTAMVASLVAFVAAVGLPDAVMRLYVDAESSKRAQQVFITTVFVFQLMFGALLVAFLALFGEQLFGFLFSSVPFSPYILLAIGIGYLTSVIAVVPQPLFRIRRQPIRFVILSAIMLSLNVALTVYFVVGRKEGALGSLKGAFVATLLMSIVYVLSIRKDFGWHFSRSQLKRALIFGLPLVPQAISFWLLGLSDRAILAANTSLGDVGIYTLAYQFALVLQVINLSVDAAWRAFVFRAVGSSTQSKWIPRLSTYYILGLAFVAWGIAVFGVDAIALVTPQSYHGASQVLPWLTLAMFMIVFYQVWSGTVLASKKTGGLAVITFVAALLNVGLNLYLVPRFGMMAAAVNAVIGYAALAAGAYFLARRVYPIPYEYSRWLRVIIVAVGSAFLALVVFSTQPALISIVGKSLLALAWPLLLYIVGFWTSQELAFAQQTALRVVAKFRGKEAASPM